MGLIDYIRYTIIPRIFRDHIKCKFCKMSVARNNILTHTFRQCQFRYIECKFCEKRVFYKFYQKHINCDCRINLKGII